MKLLPAMTDLTAFTAKSTGVQAKMEDQVKLMGYVLEGQIGRLKLMGITMTDAQKEMIATGDSAERLAAFLEAVETNAGGVAEAMGVTATGQMKIFKAEIDDFLKTTGSGFVKFFGTISKGFNTFFKHDESLTNLTNSIWKLQSMLGKGIITQKEYNDIMDKYRGLNLANLGLTESQVKQNALLQEKIKQVYNKLNDEKEIRQLIIEVLGKENILREKNSQILLGDLLNLNKENKAEEKVLLSKEELTKKLDNIYLARQNIIKSIKNKRSATKEEEEELYNLLQVEREYTLQLDELNNKIETNINLYDEANQQLSTNKKELQDVTLRIIRNGDATGELTIRQQALIESIRLEASEFKLVKDVVDEVNNAFKETDEIINVSMTSFDNLRQKLESQIEAMKLFQETSGELGMEGTQEDIDNLADRLKHLEDGDWNAVDAAEELNKETGTNFVTANKINKKAAEELDIRLVTLTTTTQGFIDKLKEAQLEITNLNNMPLNDKSATWTIIIKKVNE